MTFSPILWTGIFTSLNRYHQIVLFHDKKRGLGPLSEILIGEHRIEDSFHAGAIREDSHPKALFPYFAESSLDGVCGSKLRPTRGILEMKEGQYLFFIRKHTVNNLGFGASSSPAEITGLLRPGPQDHIFFINVEIVLFIKLIWRYVCAAGASIPFFLPAWLLRFVWRQPFVTPLTGISISWRSVTL